MDHLSNVGWNLNQTTLCARAHKSREHGVCAVGASMWAVDACAHVHPSACVRAWVSMLLLVFRVRQLTWPMISMSTLRPVQAFAVPKKRMVEPFMNSRHCARLSIVPTITTATNSKILAVRRKPSGTVVNAWTWWSMSPSTARVPKKTLIACRVVREELPRKVRSCMVGRIRFESTLKSLRVVRFGSIARGAQRTTCSRIPFDE